MENTRLQKIVFIIVLYQIVALLSCIIPQFCSCILEYNMYKLQFLLLVYIVLACVPLSRMRMLHPMMMKMVVMPMVVEMTKMEMRLRRTKPGIQGCCNKSLGFQLRLLKVRFLVIGNLLLCLTVLQEFCNGQ